MTVSRDPSHAPADPLAGLLPRLPAGVRVMLTAMLAVIGSGYLVAVVNIYYVHGGADGRAGLTMDDLRAVYSGLAVRGGSPAPSRMLTMLRGAMRQYIDSDADFAVLEAWLVGGGRRDELDEGEPGRTPRRVIVRHCLRCHARSTGTEISSKSSFAPDEFDVDPDLLARFVAVGTDAAGRPAMTPPQYATARLVLVSHQHMLAIPMFTLVVGLLFSATRWPWRLRGVVTPLPMLALILDFSGWWLARGWAPMVYAIVAAGAVFGVVLGVQIIAVAVDLWRPAGALDPSRS